MQAFNLETLLNPRVIEKLEEIYQADETYLKLLKEENLIYEKLSKKLLEKQAAELEHYFESVTATASRKQILTYIQGMKDLFALFVALSN